jgi:hypothetical protein
MTTQIDPVLYLRFPKLDVAGALFLAKVLLQRVPKGSSASVRKSASILTESLDDLREKWARQSVPGSRKLQPLARRLGGAWAAVRDRLLAYEASPEGDVDRVRARTIHDVLFPDGLEFVLMPFTHLHGETERRLLMIDERGFAKDLARLVGDHFLGVLRMAYQVAGDALGVNKAVKPEVPVLVVEPLRVLTDAISGYALQLLAVARLDPEKREAIVFALAPIDEYRATVGRRVVAEADDAEEEPPDEGTVVDDTTPAPVVPLPVAPVITELEPTG